MPKKMVIYTDHAEARMTGRVIEKAWVGEVLKNPDALATVKFGR